MTQSLDYDPSDLTREADAAAEQASGEKLLRQIEKGDIKWLMAHKQGRRIIWRLLGRTGLFQSSFRGDGDSYTTFREGVRSIGLLLLADVNEICPERYLEMLMEQKPK